MIWTIALWLAGVSSLTAQPVVTGLAGIGLRVSDLQQAEAFYSGMLEFPVRESLGGRTREFTVNPRQRLMVTERATGEKAARITQLVLEVRGARELRRLLFDRGWAPEPLTREEAAGRWSFSLREPSGVRIELVEPARASAAAFPRHVQGAGIAIPLALADQAVAFWRDALGLVETGREWVDGRSLRIRLAAPEFVIDLLAGGQPPRDSFRILARDFSAAWRRASARGAAGEPPVRAEGGWLFRLRDPDGLRIDLAGAGNAHP